MASDTQKTLGEITHYGKVYSYPCGVVDILASTRPVFREPGYEDANAWAKPARPKAEGQKPKQGASEPADMERSMRRAKARVRRLALSNDFRWFVTLTLSPDKVDRYNPAEVVRKLNQWCSNQVKRKGLRYVLVPERHKDGAIHFHGFFNDCLEAVPSGHTDKQGHMIFNLPGWTLGFTAAVQVYGEYPKAVAYVCKYIGKQGDKPAGRWYYSGGDLREPEITYGELSPRELQEQYGKRAYTFWVPGQIMTVVNGVTVDREKGEEQMTMDWEPFYEGEENDTPDDVGIGFDEWLENVRESV